MVDFAYRVAIDTYEQMNGKIKIPYMVFERLETPTRHGWLRRILRALHERLSPQLSGSTTQQPRISPHGTR